LAQAREIENNLKYKADSKLNEKFNKSNNQKNVNDMQFQQKLDHKEAKRLEKEERLRLHNEMMERRRQEKCDSFERKISNAEYLKD